MKVLLLVALSMLVSVDPATVRKINSAKSAAEDAFKSGDYKTAIRHYKFLVDSLGVNEDEVVLNLANAYYLAKDTANAFNGYQSVTESPKSDIKSKANQQLGIMANQQGRAEEALNFFKQAIKAEPSNDDARYNYEMLKKKLEEKKKEEEKQKQNKDQQKQDQENKDQQKKEEQDKDQKQDDQKNKDEQNKDQQQKEQKEKEQKEQKEQEEKEQKEKEKQEQEKKEAEKKEMQNLDKDKLEQMKISEEKARMILEAMKNQEKQYLQQQKRKSTQSRDRNKPDW
jgi:Ca-activated chloride channel homolog